MYLIIVTQYKRKLMFLLIFILFWTAVLFIGSYIARTNLLFTITINGQINFSYPFTFSIDNIYINEKVAYASIETNLAFSKPNQLKFSTYNSITGKFSFQYPSIYVLSIRDFAGSEILYHIEFQEKSNGAHGFVQVWDLPYSLEEFLEASKEGAMQNYTSFQEKPITINQLNGYFWDFALLGGSGEMYRGHEVFLKKGNRMYRISYFVPQSQWDESHSQIFARIVNSFKVS